MRSFALLLSIIIGSPFISSAWPHGGGIDTYGCHHDRKFGGYHCHQGAFAGQAFISQAEMLAALKDLKPLKDIKGKDTGVSKDRETCIREKGTGDIVCGDAILPEK
jgi:hypothetical protein